MKCLAFAALFVAAATSAHAQTHVQGYTRQNGTYVAPHYRSAPDSNPNNNWGTSPNVNPYTGQQGTHQPSYGYTAPQPSPNYFGNNLNQPRR
jgi:hypothetical protein